MSGRRTRLQRSPWQRLYEPLLIEVEALRLQLALLSKQIALQVHAPAHVIVAQERPASFEHALAVGLVQLELLLPETLLQLELLDSACIGGARIVTPRAQAVVLQVEVERILLLLQLQVAAVVRVRCAGHDDGCRCKHQQRQKKVRESGHILLRPRPGAVVPRASAASA